MSPFLLPAVDALEKLRSGEVSGIIETDDGFFLVRCDAYEPGQEPDFQSVQRQLKEAYTRNAFAHLVDERVAQLQKKARMSPRNPARFHAAVVDAAYEIINR